MKGCKRLKDGFNNEAFWKCGKVDIAVFKSHKTGLWGINVDNFIFKNTIKTRNQAIKEVKRALRSKK